MSSFLLERQVCSTCLSRQGDVWCNDESTEIRVSLIRRERCRKTNQVRRRYTVLVTPSGGHTLNLMWRQVTVHCTWCDVRRPCNVLHVTSWSIMVTEVRGFFKVGMSLSTGVAIRRDLIQYTCFVFFLFSFFLLLTPISGSARDGSQRLEFDPIHRQICVSQQIIYRLATIVF